MRTLVKMQSAAKHIEIFKQRIVQRFSAAVIGKGFAVAEKQVGFFVILGSVQEAHLFVIVGMIFLPALQFIVFLQVLKQFKLAGCFYVEIRCLHFFNGILYLRR
jgi:hypothetical protein